LDTTELHQSIALTLLDGIGPKNAKTLVAYLGGVDALFETRSFKKIAIPGFSPERLKALNRKEALTKAEKEIAFIEKNKVNTYFYLDKDYPHRLKNCIDAPLMLYSFGKAESNPAKTISIVGTRNVTTYGHVIVEELIAALIPYNVQVVSGLAYGVDILTHRACLKHGLSTVGVLGHGLDRIYPSHHRATAKKMLSTNGGLYTEFPSGTNPDRENFPRRNRIVAGMTDA
jgi:DNA processing protein